MPGVAAEGMQSRNLRFGFHMKNVVASQAHVNLLSIEGNDISKPSAKSLTIPTLKTSNLG